MLYCHMCCFVHDSVTGDKLTPIIVESGIWLETATRRPFVEIARLFHPCEVVTDA